LIDDIPAKFGDRNFGGGDWYIPNLIVVGSVTSTGNLSPSSQQADYVTIYAPGNQIQSPVGTAGGTSFGKPNYLGFQLMKTLTVG
jgi:hypothetical protein